MDGVLWPLFFSFLLTPLYRSFDFKRNDIKYGVVPNKYLGRPLDTFLYALCFLKKEHRKDGVRRTYLDKFTY